MTLVEFTRILCYILQWFNKAPISDMLTRGTKHNYCDGDDKGSMGVMAA